MTLIELFLRIVAALMVFSYSVT